MSQEKTEITQLNESISTTNERRDFLRNSVLAAGAVASLAVAESASAQTCYDAGGNIVKATGGLQVIDLTFTSNAVVLDDVFSAIKQLGKLTGCLNCGFNGFDLRMRINPVIRLDTKVLSAVTVSHQ